MKLKQVDWDEYTPEQYQWVVMQLIQGHKLFEPTKEQLQHEENVELLMDWELLEQCK